MVDVTSKQYKIYITPKTGEFTYGDEIQVSAEILFNGIKTMRKSIDSSDYDIGVYTYGDISLKLINKDGKYNDESDSRSIFPSSRDLAKVRVDYSDNAGDVTRFNGLINEEATKQDFNKEQVAFRVLSNDSVIRTTKVSGGTITNGVLASEAIKVILNQTKITSILNFEESNINVDQDFIVDDGSKFDNKNVRAALNDLLVASNSVLIIDFSDNMIVQSRNASEVNLTNLYGPYDELLRQNIHSVSKYNIGKHRTFTSVKIGDIEVDDDAFVKDFGFAQFERTLDFITSDETKTTVATRILEEFKTPQIELEVSVPTPIVKNIGLLDRVSLNYPLRIKRVKDKFLPVVGITTIGNDEMPLPSTHGTAAIDSTIAFKVIAIAEKPTTFETILKLRQFGYFTDSESSIIGFAVIGDSIIIGTGDACDKFFEAPIAAGKIGCTLMA